MNDQEFAAEVLPVIMKLFPQLSGKMENNDELQAAWFRACGKYPAEKCKAALRLMIDESVISFPEPFMLKTKLGLMAHAEVRPRDTIKEEQDKAKHAQERKEAERILLTMTDAEIEEHYLIYCASDPLLKWGCRDPLRVMDKKTQRMVIAPQIAAAVSRRVGRGLTWEQLIECDKNGNLFDVSFVEFQECRKLRAEGLRTGTMTDAIAKSPFSAKESKEINEHA